MDPEEITRMLHIKSYLPIRAVGPKEITRLLHEEANENVPDSDEAREQINDYQSKHDSESEEDSVNSEENENAS
jgi:hypothetical protein